VDFEAISDFLADEVQISGIKSTDPLSMSFA
jgi:hypothetical protein